MALFSTLAGIALGVGFFTFVYARGYSYLSNDPTACANCHIMDDHFAGWLKSSHKSAAVCNDCHTPSGFFAKYATKASNGLWHSVAFTTGNFPDPIRIKHSNLEVTEEACMKCHEDITAAIVPGPHLTGVSTRAMPEEGALACVHCHDNVGHWVR